MEIPGNDSLRKAPFAASGHYQMKSVAESTTARYRVVPAVDNDGYNNEDIVIPSDTNYRNHHLYMEHVDSSYNYQHYEMDQARPWNNTPSIHSSGSAPLPSIVHHFDNGEYYTEDYVVRPVSFAPSYDRYMSSHVHSNPYTRTYNSPYVYDTPEDEYMNNYPHPPLDAYNPMSRYPTLMHRSKTYHAPTYNYPPSTHRVKPLPEKKPKNKTDPRLVKRVNSLSMVDPDHLSSSPMPVDSLENIPALVTTQSGCRRLQSEIDRRGVQVIDLICRELGSALKNLLMNNYGNYLFQKMVTVASDRQKKRIIEMVADILPIASKNMQGTRCVQTMIDNCKQEDMLRDIVSALLPSAFSLSADSYGNHVIAKCLEVKPAHIRYPLYEKIIAVADKLAKEKYGCSVINKCILVMESPYRERLLAVLYANVIELMQDNHGNYVIQVIIKDVLREESRQFCESILGNVIVLSMQRCSSNVVESVIIHGDEDIRDKVIDEIIQSPALKEMIFDNFGNYVIQKALIRSTDEKKAELSEKIKQYAPLLENSRLGRSILSKL